ncbi:MAG: SPOR domain-containing protein [Gallionella sp.]
MAKQISVDEQNLRRKARRRLIGAFALTLAVVVILPMVLDSEPSSSRQDIELRIPAADEVGEFVPKVSGSDTTVVLPSSVSLLDPAVTPPATPNKVPDREQPSSQTASKTTDKPASVVAEGFVAQVGAYSNADTAKQLLNNLKKWGFRAAYTEKVADVIRVRVGPYADREKAEKVGQQLEKHGLHPVVMTAKGS